MPEFHVGQEVRIFGINARRHQEGEQPGDVGQVVKVGRKLVTVAPLFDGRLGSTRQYRMEDGHFNDPNWSSHYWIKTPEQVEADNRLRVAWRRVKDGGLDRPPSNRFSVSVEKLERIADILEET